MRSNSALIKTPDDPIQPADCQIRVLETQEFYGIRKQLLLGLSEHPYSLKVGIWVNLKAALIKKWANLLQAAQHKYHTILDVHLSIFTFSNFLLQFLWNIPS